MQTRNTIQRQIVLQAVNLNSQFYSFLLTQE